MPRLIDADALMRVLVSLKQDYAEEGSFLREKAVTCLIKILQNESTSPTIEAEPVVRSNWEYHCVGRFPRAPYHDIMRCPVCSYTHPKLTGYSYKRCMNCGAKMDGGANNV